MYRSPKRLIYSLTAALLLATIFAFSKNTVEDPIDRLVAALQKWTTAAPQEKVYLHMDKPYYTLGDTVWFKGYVTTGSRHQLSAISGALYVDLINERDSVVKDLKLPITTGMAMGDIVLGDDIEEGNYRIRAYTQWMRNAGEEYYFDKTFTIGAVVNDGIVTRADYQYKDIDGKPVLAATLNYTDGEGKPLPNKNITYRIVIDKKVVWTKSAKTDANGNITVNIANDKQADLTGAYIRTTLDNSSNKEVNKNFPIKAALSQSDVQFFPESGNLINGVTSRIAFKATGVDGLGIPVEGRIIETGSTKEVTNFSAVHAGMGSFILRPELNKTYLAQVTFADKSVKTIPLPVVANEGYVLSVYQPAKDSVLVRINTNEGRADQSVGLIVQSAGETVFASNISINKPMTSVWLDKKAFPTGIAQFTLLNAAGEAMNERIAFIKSNDRLTLDIKPNKATYKGKEQASMALSVKDGDGKLTAGNFSVSVVDESKIPSDEANETSIFSGLLLTSDLKGYIEKPNYYFLNDNEATDKALDNLMLTQGYRRFVWKDIVNGTNAAAKPKYPAEGSGITISGSVQTLTKKPAPGATVTLLSVRANIAKQTTADAEGKFKFDGIFLTDSIKFAVQGRIKKNSDKLIIKLDKIPEQKVTRNPNTGDLTTNIPGTLKAYIKADKKQDEINFKMGRIDKVQRLREVNIRAAKAKGPEISPQYAYRVPPGIVDQTVVLKDPSECATLAGCLVGVLGRGVVFTGKGNAPLYPHIPEKGQLMPLTIFLNGRILAEDEAEDVMTFEMDLDQIAKVELVRWSIATPKGVYIYTYKNLIRKLYNPSMANITPKGFNKTREFYSPKYDKPGPVMQIPDMRSTIYWDPNVRTDLAGGGSFSFYTGDGPGTYRVLIEGIGNDGKLGRQVMRFTVDGELVNGTAPYVIPDQRTFAIKLY